MCKINDEFCVIRADLSHFEGICLVENRCFTEPWSEQSIYDTLSLSEYTYFAAHTKTGAIVGYVAMYQVLDEAHIVNIAVLSEYRRMGIADKLLKVLTDYGVFKENDPVSVFFLEVRQSNSAAIELYRKHGFKEYGIRKNYYRNPSENAVLMSYNYLDSADEIEL